MTQFTTIDPTALTTIHGGGKAEDEKMVAEAGRTIIERGLQFVGSRLGGPVGGAIGKQVGKTLSDGIEAQSPAQADALLRNQALTGI